MKKILKIALAGLLVLILLIVAGVIFINLSSTKRKAADYLSKYLKDEYGLRLESKDLDYEFHRNFIRVRLNNVRIYGG
ncbi:MAG: hypothetical protein ACRD4B_06310, partial [Acidobacteriota bacterium]